MSERNPEPRKMFTCSLCGRECRSLYSQPGDRSAQFCSTCFFREPLTEPAPRRARG